MLRDSSFWVNATEILENDVKRTPWYDAGGGTTSLDGQTS